MIENVPHRDGEDVGRQFKALIYDWLLFWLQLIAKRTSVLQLRHYLH